MTDIARTREIGCPSEEIIAFARPEYAALAEEFGRLAAAFGLVIGHDLRRDIARLASCIERIDRRIDEATDDVERRQRWSDVVAMLEDDDVPLWWDASSSSSCPHELRVAAEDLRDLALSRGVLGRVRRIVRDEARTSEAIRVATTMRAFVRVVEREGRLTAALAIAIAGSSFAMRPRRDHATTPRCASQNPAAFRRFFFRMAAPANLVDKLLDARGDHARGEISIVPGVWLYVMLAIALVRRGFMLLITCAKPVLIARLAIRYLGP